MTEPEQPSRRRRILRGLVKAVLYLIILAELALLLPLCVPPSIGLDNEAERQVTGYHMKELYRALERFRAEYGSYPCDATARLLAARHPGLKEENLRGENANAYLRQLFCMKEPADERLFFAELMSADGTLLTREGDQQLQHQALEPGENAMGYVLHLAEGGRREAVQPGGPPTPLLICPLHRTNAPMSADKLLLDNYSLRSHFLVLYSDGKVRDVEEDCEEDEADEDLARPTRSLFPTLPDGSDSAPQHLVLPPQL